MAARTELELLLVGNTQQYLFKTYEPIILLSLVEEFTADFYINGNRFDNLVIDNLDWIPRYINTVVNSIEADVYANIDDTIKHEPNIGADLIYMVSEEWDSTSSMLYSMIHTRARELLYPVYNFLANHLDIGTCVQFVNARVINESSIELTFNVIPNTFIETKLKHLGCNYGTTNRNHSGGPRGLVSPASSTGLHGLL